MFIAWGNVKVSDNRFQTFLCIECGHLNNVLMDPLATAGGWRSFVIT